MTWRSLLAAVLLLGIAATFTGGAPAHASAPHPIALLAGHGSVRAGPSGDRIHPQILPPPPPFDWDQMWFNQSGNAKQDTAAGRGAVLVVDDPHKQAIMFGGETPAVGLTNTTFRVNQTTAIWNLLKESTAPSPRTDFSFASGAACGVAVLFGGLVNRTTSAVTNDTWLFNYTTLKWTNITGSVGPAPRQGAALAVDTTRCQAVLFGGVNVDYHSGNSTGSVRWNDTWALDLATHRWHPVNATNTPPSLADAGFLYDNASDVFLLYGGCESLCSGEIWTFRSTTLHWGLVAATTDPPTARGGMVWAYAPTYDVAILTDGYQLSGNTRSALNDSYVYEINSNRFDALGPPEPDARYLAPGGWLGANGCPGLVLLGGGGAPTNPPDEWFMDPAPDIPLACDTWGNDSISSGGQGGGAGCDTGFNLTVEVLAAPGNAPLREANVTISGNCSRGSHLTGLAGSTSFDLAYQPYTITATDPGYHSNGTTYTPRPPAVNDTITLVLVPLPKLILHTYVVDAIGNRVPLGNVSITTGPGIPLGTTDPDGLLTRDAYEPPGIFETFEANKTNYSGASVTSPIPYTGPWYVNLTLQAPGPIDVQVVEAGVLTPLPGALITVGRIATEPPGGFQKVGNPDGWANGTLVAGNYTATATLAGYAPLGILPPFYHPWAKTTLVQINLTSDRGYTIDVRIMDGPTGQPIAGAHVQVGVYPINDTSPSGWANRSSIKPAGTYEVVAWASNFTSNRTSVELSYRQPIWIIVLNLTPVGGCANSGKGCEKAPGQTTVIQPLVLWPGSPPSVALIFGGGALVVLVPAALLWSLRRRPAAVPSEGTS